MWGSAGDRGGGRYWSEGPLAVTFKSGPFVPPIMLELFAAEFGGKGVVTEPWGTLPGCCLLLSCYDPRSSESFLHIQGLNPIELKSWKCKTPLSPKMLHIPNPFIVVLSLTCVRLSVTPWTAAYQVPLSFTDSWSWLKLISVELVLPSNHLILCHPLLFLPSTFPSIRVFSNKSALRIWWPKYCSFSFSISPSNEYSRLISFRMDWLDLLAVPGTLKSLLQHHSLKASILQRSAFFMVQLAHPYITAGKTIAWNIQNKMSLPWQMEIHPNVSWVCSVHSYNLTPIQHVPIDTSCIRCWWKRTIVMTTSSNVCYGSISGAYVVNAHCVLGSKKFNLFLLQKPETQLQLI